MGYTHYWRRQRRIELTPFKKIVEDFSKVVPVLAKHGVPLAGGLGEGAPVINQKEIWFNGPEKCGHPQNNTVTIPWPASGATGIDQSDSSVSGEWYAGALLDARCCDGDCSYETFHLERILKPESYQRPENGKYFAFCKTAFRPYDIAVTACLLIAKRYLGDAIRVSTDGEDEHWFDAKMLCQSELGYGLEYSISDEGELTTLVRADAEANG